MLNETLSFPVPIRFTIKELVDLGKVEGETLVIVKALEKLIKTNKIIALNIVKVNVFLVMCNHSIVTME